MGCILQTYSIYSGKLELNTILAYIYIAHNQHPEWRVTGSAVYYPVPWRLASEGHMIC